MKSSINKQHVYFGVAIALVVLMCAFVFYMSAQPADDSDELSMGVVYRIIGFIVPGYDALSPEDQLMWQKALNHPVRKFAHFSEFALLGMLFLNMFWQGSKLKTSRIEKKSAQPTDALSAMETPSIPLSIPRQLLRLGALALACTAVYAATDEIHQLFVPGRAGMISDVLLDSAGAFVGILLFAIVLGIIASKRRKR